MELTIKYFGMLAEVTKCGEEKLDCAAKTIEELLDFLFVKYPDLKGKEFKVAQGQEFVSLEAPLAETELVLLPPFSGG
ncbi:MoaD/ThiS family protein [Aquimarina sp. TRL1]|uniref:MoaD/ThiS family protein n=1 Tax=Aquimarina sp. (strain TRL1) TaxID=2736252 RepID=UPI00158CD4CF|nr:MoaD/ThiS family protein [Aquimarina sp. TRL1]QKX04020.1 MoaD/ThiS family protein [Aquimarina sp. TRL1]